MRFPSPAELVPGTAGLEEVGSGLVSALLFPGGRTNKVFKVTTRIRNSLLTPLWLVSKLQSAGALSAFRALQ